MDPNVISNIDPSTVVPLIAGLTIACLSVPLSLCLAPAALVCGYVGCAAGAYGTALAAPLLPCLLPCLLPLAHVGCGCGGHQIPFQWKY